MKKTSFFNIESSGARCTLLLYGDIGEGCGNVSSGEIARELMAAEKRYEGIDVRINSNGGEVYTGIAIFNALRNSKADIRIFVDGIAASMASVIALCGKPVEMSKYARLMLHSVSGGCYGNKKDLRSMLEEIEGLEDTLCEMYARKMGQSPEEIKEAYFDGKDHWLTAEQALNLSLIDGIYDADPVPEESTIEQIYTIFNNRLESHKKTIDMNIDEIKKRPQFKDCATDADVLKRIGELEEKAAQAEALESENTELKGKVQAHDAAAEEAAASERKQLLDDAEAEGKINAETRPIYENMLKEHPEDGKKALNALPTKQRATDYLGGGSGGGSAWAARQAEIQNNYKGK